MRHSDLWMGRGATGGRGIEGLVIYHLVREAMHLGFVDISSGCVDDSWSYYHVLE